MTTPYEEAAAKYRPLTTETLFIAEAPPRAINRHFYFEKVHRGDWLWLALMKELFRDFGIVKVERYRKAIWLNRFKEKGYQLIDAVKCPIDGTQSQRVARIKEHSDSLISEIKQMTPKKIVLIKFTVHDGLYAKLTKAGLPVQGARLPFPSSGRQKIFHDRFPPGI